MRGAHYSWRKLTAGMTSSHEIVLDKQRELAVVNSMIDKTLILESVRSKSLKLARLSEIPVGWHRGT